MKPLDQDHVATIGGAAADRDPEQIIVIGPYPEPPPVPTLPIEPPPSYEMR